MPCSKLGWFLFVVCVTFVSVNGKISAHGKPDGAEEQKSEEEVAYLDLLSGDWEIFEPKEFEKNELCAVLQCKETDVCVVKHNNAICLSREKLQFSSTRFAAKASESDEKPASDDTVQDRKMKAHLSEKLKQEEDAKAADATKWDPVKQLFKHRKHQQKEKDNKATGKSGKNSKSKNKSKEDSRSSREGKDPADCTEKDIIAMRKRLVNWFEAIHEHDLKSGQANLPEHVATCQAEVGWMFAKLDDDKDGSLDSHELQSVENDPYELCLKPFFDRCDQNADDDISLDEWCDCFQYSGRDREEPPCHLARHSVNPHLTGAFMPRCDADGFYKPAQCHERECWCVDKFGREFQGSRVNGGRPDCGQYAEEPKPQE